MNFFSLIPTPWKVGASILALITVFGLWQWHEESLREEGYQSCQKDYSDARQQAQEIANARVKEANARTKQKKAEFVAKITETAHDPADPNIVSAINGLLDR